MEVAYIIGQSGGGLPHYTAELANAVGEHVDVTVLKPEETSADGAFGDHVTLREPFQSIDVTMPKLYSYDVDPREVLAGVRSYGALRRIADVDPTVVHDTTGLFPHVRLALRWTGIDSRYPFVATRHEVSETRFPVTRPVVLAENLFNSVLPAIDVDRTVVHTQKQKHAVVSRGRAPEHVSVIPHGAYSLFGSSDDVDRSPESNTLLFFGNIVPPKGLDTLVEAMTIVREAIPDATLVIAGDGTISERSRAIIESYPEQFEVHNYFVPNDEVKDLFARAEAVAMPYEFQGGTKGHSGALATAFSFGTPVVASTAGEFYSLVHAEGCGKVVPPGNAEKFADAIVAVLEDPELRREMRANCLRMAEELSWDAIAERHLEVYEAVAPRRPRASVG